MSSAVTELPPPVPAFARGAAQSLAVGVAGTASLAVSGVLVARFLGPGGRGEYALLTLAGMACGALVSLGVELWIARRVAADGAIEAPVAAAVRRHAAYGGGAIVTAAVVAGGPLVALDVVDATAVGAVAVVGGGQLLWALAGAAALGARRMGVYALVALVPTAGLVLTVVALDLAGSTSARTPVVAAGVLRAVGAAAGWLWLRTPRGAPSTAAAALHREAVRFGRPAALGGLLTFGVYRVDAVLVGAFLDVPAVGRYTSAASVTEGLWLVPDALALVLLPHVSRHPDRADSAALVRVTCLAVGAAAVAIAAAGPWLLRTLFGPAFAEEPGVLWPLAVAAVALAGWKLLVADLAGRGDTGIRLTSAGAALAGMCLVDLVLIPAYGVEGAGGGAAVGYAIAMAMVVTRWRKATGEAVLSLFVPRRGDLRRLRHLAPDRTVP